MGKHLKIIFILLTLCLIGVTEVQAAPTEYTEEQTQHNTDVSIKGTNAPTCGQKLTIPNRTITKLAFYIGKEGSPTGDVTFTIRKVTNGSIIVSKVWGDAADLPTELTWIEVEFDAPTLINEEVRMLIEHTGYDDNNYIKSRLQSSNVKDNERWTRGGVGSWSEAQDWDFVYRYTYTEYTEEQTEYDMDINIGYGDWDTCGQKLNISNRRVTKLGFWLSKVGTPPGVYSYRILDASDHSEIYSQQAGTSSDLTTDPQYYEIELDTPQELNKEVVIGVTDNETDTSNYIQVHVKNDDVKANENMQRHSTEWTDDTAYDTAYRYTYEMIEQQIQGENYWMLEHRYATKIGQRLNISNRIVTKLGFWLERFGSPTEDLTFEIRRASNDTVISSKVWGNASELSTTTTYEEVEFVDPQLINEEVRIVASIAETTDNNGALIYRQNADVKENELYTEYLAPSWTDNSDYDCAYRYTYTLPEISSPTVTTSPATAVGTTTATLNGEITDDGGEACEYRFEYDTDSGESYASSTGWTGSVTTSQSFSEDISGLLKGTLYYFRAQAKNSAATSSGSELTFLTKPEAPSNLSVTTKTKDLITLSWTKGEGSQKTLIRYDTSNYPNSTSSGSLAYLDTGTTTTVNSLSSGQIYYFRAWSYTLKDSKEQYSDNTSDANDYTKPGEPSNLTASNPTDNSLDLSWTKGEGGDKTIIRRKTNSYPTSTTDGTQAYFDTGTTTTDSDLDPNTTYYYRAWAYDSDSQYYSDSYSQTTDGKYTLANPPSNLLLTTDSPNQIAISWQANNNPEGTEYFCENITAGTNSGWITETSWVSINLLAGTEYTFRVKARNGDEVSTSWTSEESLSTFSAGGAAPVLPPVSITGSGNVSQNLGGEISQTFNSGKIAKVVFPSYSIKGTVVSKIEPKDKTEIIKNNPLPQNAQIIGDLVADFKALSGIKEIESFEKEVTVTFTYTDQQVKEAKIDETTLKIYWWDKDTQTWKPLKSNINTLTNTITALTSHFTLFAVMGETKEEKTVEGMTIEEIKAKIREIQQKIIELLTQLTQIIQEEIIQLQS